MAAIMAAIMEITENIMRRMHEPSTKLHNALYFMSGMMVVILALVIVAGVKTKAENAGFHIADDTENSYEQQVAGQTDTTQDSGQEKWQEGVVAYQGKEYLYNTDIKTYLMMGVDIDGPVPVLLINDLCAFQRHDPRAVYQDIYLAKSFHCLLDHRGSVFLVANISCNSDGFVAAHLLGDLIYLRVQISQNNVDALLQKVFRRHISDPGRASCDDRCLSSKVKVQ